MFAGLTEIFSQVTLYWASTLSTYFMQPHMRTDPVTLLLHVRKFQNLLLKLMQGVVTYLTC